MPDTLYTLTAMADFLAEDEGVLRRISNRPDYQGALGVPERLLEIAEHLRAVRQPIEASIERLRAHG